MKFLLKVFRHGSGGDWGFCLLVFLAFPPLFVCLPSRGRGFLPSSPAWLSSPALSVSIHHGFPVGTNVSPVGVTMVLLTAVCVFTPLCFQFFDSEELLLKKRLRWARVGAFTLLSRWTLRNVTSAQPQSKQVTCGEQPKTTRQLCCCVWFSFLFDGSKCRFKSKRLVSTAVFHHLPLTPFF